MIRGTNAAVVGAEICQPRRELDAGRIDQRPDLPFRKISMNCRDADRQERTSALRDGLAGPVVEDVLAAGGKRISNPPLPCWNRLASRQKQSSDFLAVENPLENVGNPAVGDDHVFPDGGRVPGGFHLAHPAPRPAATPPAPPPLTQPS